MESDPQLESLSCSRDLEGDQSRVLTGEEGLEAPARAVRIGPLVQRELVVLLAREHLPVQLPPVEHLAVLVGSEFRVQQRYNSYHDHARLAVHVTVEDLQLYQHVGVGDQVEAAGLAPPW